MLKITGIGDIYCLKCGEDEEGALLDYEQERADLTGSSCVKCERVLL